MKTIKYEMGIKAMDTITGFSGVITGFCRYLTGCDQYLIQPPIDKEGKHVSARWHDENRLKVVDNKALAIDTDDDNGPCDPAPIK